MIRFTTVTFYAFIVNTLVIYFINMVLKFPMEEIYVAMWGLVTALIGVGLSYAIRYAIKLAKGHKV